MSNDGTTVNLDELVASMPFADGLGMTLETATADRVEARMDWAPERCTIGGVLHGGALMSLADTTGAVCAYLGLPEGAGTATTTATTHLLRAVTAGTVHAVATPVHRGRSQVVVQTDLTDDRGRLVARMTQVQAVLPG